uniref:C2H2-type domain-containing protein n=1 Tax=Nothobranchius furzeri TaxID=105023 RepID=A0A8C6Q7M1_NOTFU
MAEGSSTCDTEGLETQLQSLLSRFSGGQLGVDSEPFCSDFCKVVEEFASRCDAPLPQLRILDVALSYFCRGSAFFSTSGEQVQQTISSLALSIFELLLFFDQKEFCSEPLKEFRITFQECHSVLEKYENVYLLQVERLVRDGGPWASPALQAILSESRLPQLEVERCITSELPAFLELRVRYLLSRRRLAEAMALAKCCVLHLAARQHLFFLQVRRVPLLLDSLLFCCSYRDAVNIICNLEREETDEVLLSLSAAFLSHQLQRGDVFYLWLFIHLSLPQAFLEECRRLMLSATNVKSIFPFIRAVLQEVGDDGVQFCVELCASALRSRLPCDVITKTCIYKTIAGLLPDDLEVCRACALLVFFCERTVESYKMVYLLYMLPDQEYHVDDSPIGNSVRFETLQVLKKDLFFDPELWSLVALRTNCLKLLSEKVVNAALDEIREDKWISKYCTKAPALSPRASICHKEATSSIVQTHLDHFCTFCNKDFKGPRVVEHAMLHYRKDECTFCRIIFKDDLLAMMHLSEHIEKLKRIKDPPAGGKAQKHQVTKDASTPKTKKPSASAKAASHRLNGHVGLKRDLREKKGHEVSSQGKPARVKNSSLQENQQLESDDSASIQPDKGFNSREDRKKKDSVQNLKKSPKQTVQKKSVEKLCCPVDGCSWFTDLSKNKVTFLYHTLEKHYGDIKPLELAFRVAENKCSICMRVLWSFEHFQHHVERHRLIPRYPCLHQGCTERFKTGNDMRRHTRKHNPLQATCCLPGCPKLFICLWALNLHEKEHYSSKSVKMKNANEQSADNLCKTPVSKNPQTSEDNAEPNAGNSTESVKPTLSSAGDQLVTARENPDSTLNSVLASALESNISALKRSKSDPKEPTCDDSAFTPSKEVLAEYGKKPHMRLPPTAYLHEKYTTMPKRRKEVLVQRCLVGVPLEPVFMKTIHQRHRCANCFTTFSSTEELQSHLQLQKCSNLFGFDSDDEGESDGVVPPKRFQG